MIDSKIIDGILIRIIEEFATTDRYILADAFEEVDDAEMANALRSREEIEIDPLQQKDYIIKDWPKKFPIIWLCRNKRGAKRIDVVYDGACYIWTNRPFWDRTLLRTINIRNNETMYWYFRKPDCDTKYSLVVGMVPLFVRAAAILGINGMQWPRIRFVGLEDNHPPRWFEKTYERVNFSWYNLP